MASDVSVFTLWLPILVVMISVLTIGICLCILRTYFKVPRLIQNPGKVIIAVLILQSIDCILVILSQFYENKEEKFDSVIFFDPKLACKYIGLIQELVSIQYTALNLFLVINLYLQLRNQFYNYRQMLFRVQILAISISIVISIFTLIEDQSRNIKLPISPLGSCAIGDNTSQLVLTIIYLMTLTAFLVILYKITKRKNKNLISVEIYSTNTEKFQRKYLQQYSKVNLFYCYIYTLMRLIPQCLLSIYSLHLQVENIEENLELRRLLNIYYLLLNVISGLIMAMIRIKEPVFQKHFLKQMSYKGKRSNLFMRLLRNTDSAASVSIFKSLDDPKLSEQLLDVENLIYQADSQNDQLDIEVTYYTLKQQTNNALYSSNQAHLSQKEEFQEIDRNSSQIDVKIQWFKIFASLPIILREDSSDTSQQILISKRPPKKLIQRMFNFSYMQRILLNCLLKDEIIAGFINSEQTGKTLQNSSEKDLIEEVYIDRENIFQAYLYGHSIIRILCEQYTSITFEQILLSLNLPSNLSLLKELSLKKQRKYGTAFISYDNLITVDVITKEHKKYLTKGGGLFQLWKTLSENTRKSESLLPLIVAVISFKFGDNTSINITLTINRIDVNYPRFDEGWSNKNTISLLLKSNVIGWTSLRQNFIIKRFLAKSVNDGQFQIILTKQDFLLLPESKDNLIYQIKKDWEVLLHFGSPYYTLQFVYRKLSSKRLLSLIQHEEKGEELSYVGSQQMNAENVLSSRLSTNHLTLGQYDLQGSLGYVEVFWDEFWTDQVQIDDHHNDKVLESMIQTIQSSF